MLLVKPIHKGIIIMILIITTTTTKRSAEIGATIVAEPIVIFSICARNKRANRIFENF